MASQSIDVCGRCRSRRRRRVRLRIGRRRNARQAASRTRRSGSRYREDAPPFSFTDATGVPAGFMVDLCRAVAEESGGAAQSRRSQGRITSSSPPPIASMRSNPARRTSCASRPSATLSRREQVDFSIATFVDGASLLVKRRRPKRVRRPRRQEGRRAGRHDHRAEPARHARQRQDQGRGRSRQDPRGGACDARPGGDRRLFRRSGHPRLSRLQEQRAGQAASRQQLSLARALRARACRAATAISASRSTGR